MHRLLLMKNTARTVSTLRHIPCISHNRIFRRNLAFLSEENDYLPNLLAEDGLVKFLKPLEAAKDGSGRMDNDAVTTTETSRGNDKYLVRFSIDRNEACIKCHVSVLEKQTKKRRNTIQWSSNYPSYDPNVSAPPIPASISSDSTKVARLKELADTLWRAFCINDFLTLQVEATLHPDGSMSFPKCSAQLDESAVHRQGNIFQHVMRQEHPDELEAEKSSLVYRRIPGGNIGTIVNGAGLAMATNDTIDLLYGKSANFLDAGEKPTPETIIEAFRLVLKNRDVNVILVNIFGGVIEGDIIAKGIISAMEELHVPVPVVIRIQGINGQLGMQMLRKSGFKDIHAEENLYDAVRLAIKLSKRKPKKLQTESQEAGPRKESRVPRTKGSPFPNVYTLIHTSPAFRTKGGRIRPAVMTFAIEGHRNRRVRLTRPWKPGDPSLNTTIISIGKAKKLLRGGLHGFLKRQENVDRVKMNSNDVEKGIQGPSAAFFSE